MSTKGLLSERTEYPKRIRTEIFTFCRNTGAELNKFYPKRQLCTLSRKNRPIFDEVPRLSTTENELNFETFNDKRFWRLY